MASPAAGGCDRRGSARVDTAVAGHSHELARARYRADNPGSPPCGGGYGQDGTGRPTSILRFRQCAAAGAGARGTRLSADARCATGLTRQSKLRPIPRHSLSPRKRAVARPVAVRGAVLPSRLSCQATRKCLRGDWCRREPGRLQPSILQLRAAAEAAEDCGESRLRGFPRALPAALTRVQGRADRLPRRFLFPCARPQSALRRLGARSGDRYRSTQRGGISRLHRFLVGAAAAGRSRAHHLCATRRQERGRRVSIPDSTRCHHSGRSALPALPASRHRQARRGPTHVHVSLRRGGRRATL